MRDLLKIRLYLIWGSTLSLTLLVACGGQGVSDGARLTSEYQPLTLLGGTGTLSVTLSLISSIASPTVTSTKLQADDIFINGVDAYVSFNVAGATQKGAIDKISTAVPLIPSLTSSITFPSTDIHGVYLSGSNVYAVGADDSLGPVLDKVPLNAAPLTSGVFGTSSLVTTLPSYAGTGVIGKGSSLYTLSGDTGGLNVFNSTTLAQTASLSIADARGIASKSSDTDLFVVAGQPGRVLEISPAGALVQTFSLGGAATPQSKSTITVGTTMVLASIGEAGSKIFCKADGTVLASIPAPTGVPGLTNDLTVTNAVAAGPGLLFVANGEAGVYIYSLQTTGALAAGSSCAAIATPTFLGSINFGTAISANNVKYSGGNLFVATGLGGFKIVSVTNVTLTSPLLDLL